MKKSNLSYVAAFMLLGSLLSTGMLMGSDNKKDNNETVMLLMKTLHYRLIRFRQHGKAASLNLLSLIKPMDNKDLHTVFTQEISYPSTAVESNTEGVVKVQFKVEPNGHVSDVSVVEKADDTLSGEVMDAVKKFRLRPIIQNGIR